MSLRQQILDDLDGIVENTEDFGQAIVLTDPAGATYPLTGLTGDISRSIEPDSGALVKGATIHVTLKIRSLPAGLRPDATNRQSENPWTVSFPNVSSALSTEYIVVGSDYDEAMGTTVLELGNWNDP